MTKLFLVKEFSFVTFDESTGMTLLMMCKFEESAMGTFLIVKEFSFVTFDESGSMTSLKLDKNEKGTKGAFLNALKSYFIKIGLKKGQRTVEMFKC